MARKPDSVSLEPRFGAPNPTGAVFDDNEQPTIVLDIAWFGDLDPISVTSTDHAELPDELRGMYYHG